MKRISILMATAFVDMIGFSMIFPLLPFYALRLDAPEWLIGWMIAIFSVAQLSSAPSWGRLSDRWGRRPAILSGLLAGAAAFTVFGLATSIWMLFLSRLIQGIGGGTTGVLQAYVGDSVQPKDRARALGWLTAATSAGVMVGPAIGSLAFNIGAAAPGLIAAGLCLTNFVFAWRWLPESFPAAQRDSFIGVGPDELETPPRRPIFQLIAEVVHSPKGQVSRLIWIYAIGMLGFMSITSVLALYMESKFGIDEKTIGIFFVYIGAMGVVMRALVLGRMVDWIGETHVMRLGAVLLASGMILIPLPGSVLPLAVFMGLVPMGTACLFPSVSALVTHRVSKQEFGQTLSVQQAFGGMARVIAPIWATAAFQGLGAHVPFYIAAGVAMLVVVMTFRIPPRPVPTGVPEAV
ncbi:MAG: MFS transporter [Gemmatimonadales bacterium]